MDKIKKFGKMVWDYWYIIWAFIFLIFAIVEVFVGYNVVHACLYVVIAWGCMIMSKLEIIEKTMKELLNGKK